MGIKLRNVKIEDAPKVSEVVKKYAPLMTIEAYILNVNYKKVLIYGIFGSKKRRRIYF